MTSRASGRSLVLNQASKGKVGNGAKVEQRWEREGGSLSVSRYGKGDREPASSFPRTGLNGYGL